MKKLHNKLLQRSRHYRRWHEHPLHRHVHWGLLGAVVVGVGLSFVILGWSKVEVSRVQVARAQSSSLTYYVATNGNDNNPGTESRPWRTIKKATSHSLQPGDTVIVKPGEYRETNDGSLRRIVYFNGIKGQPDKYIVFKSEVLHGAVIKGRQDDPNIPDVYLRDDVPTSSSPYKEYGVLFFNSKYVRFEGFEIAEVHGDGVWIADSDHIIIANSKIHHNGNRPLEDGTDTWGGPRGANGIFDNTATSYIIYDGNIVYHNGYFGTPQNGHDHGIYSNGDYHTFTNNIFGEHAGYMIKNSGYYRTTEQHLVSNNVFAFSGNRRAYFVWGETNNTIIQNNIFYNIKGGYNPYGEGAIEFNGASGNNNIIKNNIYYNSTEFIKEVVISTIQYTEYNNENVDPQFMSQEDFTGNFDFHLKENSPAIDAGIAEDSPGHDIDGNNRPSGNGYDIGAYEYVAGGPGCTPTTEICDQKDNDCDGDVDEGNVCGTTNQPPRNLRLRYLGPTP